MLSSVEKDAYYRKTNILTMTCTTNQRAHGTSSFQRAGKGRVGLVWQQEGPSPGQQIPHREIPAPIISLPRRGRKACLHLGLFGDSREGGQTGRHTHPFIK
jgi:hypothetical protein